MRSYWLSLLTFFFQAWAQDEPPSPTDDPDDRTIIRRPSESRPSDVYSYQSSGPPGSENGSRWWTFTRPRTSEPSQHMLPVAGSDQERVKPEKRASMFRERSMAWLPTSNRRSQDVSGLTPRSKGFEGHRSTMDEHQHDWGLTIDLPPPPSAPFTMAQSRTPGWDSPWTARAARPGPSQSQELFGHHADEDEKLNNTWSKRKKRLRAFVLTNTYVPLVSFTSQYLY